MKNTEQRFPIGESKIFAKRHRLLEAVKIIDDMNKKNWAAERFREVRKGKYIELLDGYNLFNDFAKTYWPNARASSGNPWTKRFYVERALDFDES